MSYISPTQLKEIQDASNIVEYIGQFVQLHKQGQDYLGLCPFHNEKTPSFHVSETKQVFHCFGCGRSGNIFQFVSQYEHVNFPEAVSKVVNFFNITTNLEVTNKQVNPKTIYRKNLLAINAKAAEFYQHILLRTKIGEAALKYLETRGITKEDIETFGIGFAPPKVNNVDPLVNIIKSDEYTEAMYDDSGLFVFDDLGKLHDRFINRIMFPIRDEYGQVIAFSGRKYNDVDDTPKYINSKETSLFNKSEVLFNLDLAKQTIREQEQVVLFEGYMDVISAYKAGIKNGIASMGTSLTKKQLQKIQKLTNKVVVCYDGDRAGLMASDRAKDELKQLPSLQANFIWLPDNLDPDEYIKAHGAEAFVQLINNEQLTSIQFTMRYLKQDLNLQKEQDKLHYTEVMLAEIKDLSSTLQQNLALQQLAQDVNINLEVLEAEINKTPVANNGKDFIAEDVPIDTVEEIAPVSEEKIKINFDNVHKAEYMLLYRAFFERSVRTLLQEHNFVFPDTNCEELYLLLEDYLEWHEVFLEEDFYNYLQLPEHQYLFGYIINLPMSAQSTRKEIEDYIKVITHAKLRDELLKKQNLLQEASKMGNIALEKQLSKEIMDLLKQLH